MNSLLIFSAASLLFYGFVWVSIQGKTDNLCATSLWGVVAQVQGTQAVRSSERQQRHKRLFIDVHNRLYDMLDLND
jgi:hypothetical protein